jgi:hypothetical protein
MKGPPPAGSGRWWNDRTRRYERLARSRRGREETFDAGPPLDVHVPGRLTRRQLFMTCLSDKLSAAMRLAGRHGAIDLEDRHDIVVQANIESIRLLLSSQSFRNRAGRIQLGGFVRPGGCPIMGVMCAPWQGSVFPAGASPARPTRSLRPEAIGAAVEVTKPPEPSRPMYRLAVQRVDRP